MFISSTDIKHFAVSLAVMVGVLAFPGEKLSAARNDAIVEPIASAYELVVIEIDGCKYCPILRRDAVPAFEASPVSREAHLRFLDLNTDDARQLELTEGPVKTVPTLLLVKGNKELGRAEGYMGPDGFVFAARWLIDNVRPSTIIPFGAGRIETGSVPPTR